jgi:hypothetical protein
MGEDAETQIRERAHLLWQKEGSPDGGDKVFWERARLLHEAASAPPIMTPLQARSAEERAVDDAVADTFPASDLPSFTATAGAGSSPGHSASGSQEGRSSAP